MEPAAAYDQRTEVEFVDVREDDEWTAGHIAAPTTSLSTSSTRGSTRSTRTGGW